MRYLLCTITLSFSYSHLDVLKNVLYFSNFMTVIDSFVVLANANVDLLFLETVGKLKETIIAGDWLDTSWFMPRLVAK